METEAGCCCGLGPGAWRGACPGLLTRDPSCDDLSRSSIAVGGVSDYVGPCPGFPAATPLLRRLRDPLWLSVRYRLQGHGKSSFCLLLLVLPATAEGWGTHRPSQRGPGLSWGRGHRRVGSLCCLSARSQAPSPSTDGGRPQRGPAYLSRGLWDAVATRGLSAVSL